MGATSQQMHLFTDYDGFVEKFKPKKTTDDCYTPPEIYDVILGYVVERYGIDPDKVSRPFYPSGDYQAEDYEGLTVVDNPPFSMLAKIIDFYQTNDVPFFLFAPTLTCISCRKHIMDINHIVCNATITYENGAKVPTSFVTNLDTDGTVLEANPELSDLIKAKDDELRHQTTKTNPKYVYPDHIMTAAKANWYAAHHTPYKLNKRDCAPIQKLDAMGGKSIYGGGLLLSERAAAERAAAERAAAHRWQLSERELKLVQYLSEKSEQE